MLTECGYEIVEGTECNGSCRVPQWRCETCPCMTRLFEANTPTQMNEKRLVVNVHAFGVTINSISEN